MKFGANPDSDTTPQPAIVIGAVNSNMMEKQGQSSESEDNVRDEEEFVPLVTNGLDRKGKHKTHSDGGPLRSISIMAISKVGEKEFGTHEDTRFPVHFLKHQCNNVSLDPCPSSTTKVNICCYIIKGRKCLHRVSHTLKSRDNSYPSVKDVHRC